jgi:hypothetical protein
MAGLTFKYNKRGLKPRRSYTDQEAKDILTAARQANRAIRWLQWLAAYTGSRVGEIAECTTYDIRQMGGGWVIDILLDNRDPNATLKTDAAHRTVALHAALIEEGFLDYVAEIQREYGDGPLTRASMMREASDATDDDSLGVAPTRAEQQIQRRGPAGSGAGFLLRTRHVIYLVECSHKSDHSSQPSGIRGTSAKAVARRPDQLSVIVSHWDYARLYSRL